MRENRNTPFHSVALQKVQDENESKILNGIDIVNRIWSMGGGGGGGESTLPFPEIVPSMLFNR
jgi:hypothetical protein